MPNSESDFVLFPSYVFPILASVPWHIKGSLPWNLVSFFFFYLNYWLWKLSHYIILEVVSEYNIKILCQANRIKIVILFGRPFMSHDLCFLLDFFLLEILSNFAIFIYLDFYSSLTHYILIAAYRPSTPSRPSAHLPSPQDQLLLCFPSAKEQGSQEYPLNMPISLCTKLTSQLYMAIAIQ